MKKRIGRIALGVGTVLFFVLVFQWSNIFNEYMIPPHPGLRRLGASFLFPRVIEVAWENEHTILFADPDIGGPGAPIFRYPISLGWPKSLLPDFRVRDFKMSPDRHLLAIVGWDYARNNNELWVIRNEDEPIPVEFGNDTLYDAFSVDWLTEDESLIVFYDQPKINSFKKIQFSPQEVTDLYYMEDGDSPSYDIDAYKNRVVYETENSDRSISVLDLKKQTVKVIKFDNYTFSNVRFLQREPWLIATAGGNGRTEIALVNAEDGCVTFPFPEFVGILRFDVLETAENIKLILTDRSGLMYIFDMAKALRHSDISSIFSCENK